MEMPSKKLACSMQRFLSVCTVLCAREGTPWESRYGSTTQGALQNAGAGAASSDVLLSFSSVEKEKKWPVLLTIAVDLAETQPAAQQPSSQQPGRPPSTTHIA